MFFCGSPTLTFLVFLTVFQYSLAPHYFLFLSFLGIKACSSLFLPSCYSFLLLLPPVQPTLVLSRFFSLQCSLLFCNLIISSPLMSITSVPYRALISTYAFGNFFSMTEFVNMLNFFFFLTFRSFVLQTCFTLLVLSPLGILIFQPLLYYFFLIFSLY